MVLFNYSTKEITAKIVYYGPGLCGKTTNLQYIYESLPGSINKGKMLSLATKTDRTLFFDFLPIDLGTIRGMRTRLQLYTVPGQVFYNTTRKLVLKGADGVVFVADSQKRMLDANLESFRNLEENLAEHDMNLAEMPLIIQFNKRDLPDVLDIEELNTAINRHNSPIYEAVATTGIGVHETLKASTRLVLNSLKEKYAERRDPQVDPGVKAAALAAIAAQANAPAAQRDPDVPPREPAEDLAASFADLDLGDPRPEAPTGGDDVVASLDPGPGQAIDAPFEAAADAGPFPQGFFDGESEARDPLKDDPLPEIAWPDEPPEEESAAGTPMEDDDFVLEIVDPEDVVQEIAGEDDQDILELVDDGPGPVDNDDFDPSLLSDAAGEAQDMPDASAPVGDAGAPLEAIPPMLHESEPGVDFSQDPDPGAGMQASNERYEEPVLVPGEEVQESPIFSSDPALFEEDRSNLDLQPEPWEEEQADEVAEPAPDGGAIEAELGVRQAIVSASGEISGRKEISLPIQLAIAGQHIEFKIRISLDLAQLSDGREETHEGSGRR